MKELDLVILLIIIEKMILIKKIKLKLMELKEQIIVY